jgi:prepilin-type processing-associated H-X9-DG protein
MDRRRARPAVTLLELLIVLAIISLCTGLLLAAIQRVREAGNRTRCSDNLRQLALALHGYHEINSVLPPATRGWRGDFPYLAWSARIMPLLEQDALWRQAKSDYDRSRNPWVPTPHFGMTHPFGLFVCPSDGRTVGVDDEGRKVAFLHYLGSSGMNGLTPDGVMYFESAVRFAHISDGASGTLLLGERPPGAGQFFGWWYAGVGQGGEGSADSHLGVRERRWTFRTPTCAPGPYHFGPGHRTDPCATFHFWSRHPGGANFAFADGSVRFLAYGIDGIMPLLSTRAGGEAVEIP